MGRTTLLVLPIALASRGVAFVVPLAIAMWFGVGAITDAWYWALAFPTFTLVLASTALGTTATPALARVRSQGTSDRVDHFVGGLLVWTGLAALLLGTTICLGAPSALPRLTRFPEQTRALAALYLWELLPFVVLNATGTVLRVSAEVHGRFASVALSPLIRASVVIGVTAALLHPLGPHALPAGLVAGEATQLGWWAVLLRRCGVRPRLSPRLDPVLRQVGRDLALILGGEVLVALNLVTDKAFAAWLPTGSVATLEFADRVRVIPQTLMESTLLMIAYATWSNLHARGRIAEARRAVDQALRWVIALAAPALAGLFIGRQVLVGLLYQRGAFTAQDTLATASVLTWLLPGVLPNLLGILAVRAHVIERHLRLVFALGLASVIVNMVGDALLINPMGVEGLALATTLNTTLIPALYLWTLRGQLNGRRWLPALGIATASAGVALWVELGPGTPHSMTDPVLWEAAVLCFGLLGLGWLVTRGRHS